MSRGASHSARQEECEARRGARLTATVGFACFPEHASRKKDIIVLPNGFNVYPDEIDRVLMGHPAVLEAATIGLPDAAEERGLEIRYILARWALLREQLADLDARISVLVEDCPEARVLLTVPSISAVCAGTIVAELGTPEDFEHWRQVVKLAGMNIVTKSSGHRPQTITPKWQSKRGRPMLRRQLFLLAGRWCQQRGLYRPDYEALLARGSSKTKAVCTLARKLVPMLLAVMQSGEAFDVERWSANRHQREVA